MLSDVIDRASSLSQFELLEVLTRFARRIDQQSLHVLDELVKDTLAGKQASKPSVSNEKNEKSMEHRSQEGAGVKKMSKLDKKKKDFDITQ